MRYVIGVDYGTQSARATLVSVESGQLLLSHTVSYAHAISEDNLVDVQIYDAALYELLHAVVTEEYRDGIVGICVDATSLTMVSLGVDGRPLTYQDDLRNCKNAQIKLWKRHNAQPQADEALQIARAMHEPFLDRTGGALSSEWMLPKLMETYDNDPQVWEHLDLALDLCEYLTMQLTGQLTRSQGSMSYKGAWAEDIGLPSDTYLNALRPGLAEKYARCMRGTVLRPGDCAGFLAPAWCEALGLSSEVKVASGVLDGHTSLVAMGALQPGDWALVIGTSTVLTVQTDELYPIAGICGIAKDGQVRDLYGIDAGQSGTGDMLAWFMENALPERYVSNAKKRDISVHQLLSEKIEKPWENNVIIADWWNGSRNAPNDLSLPGVISGLSLATRPEEIYLAMLQSIVCGTREIIELCCESGIETHRILVGGGIALKNPLLMQQYANILHQPVAVARANEVPATGAAIFAAVAAGCYSGIMEAYHNMGIQDFLWYYPEVKHDEAYESLYQKNHLLRVTIAQMQRKMEEI